MTDLDELEAKAQAATSGPWKVMYCGMGNHDGQACSVTQETATEYYDDAIFRSDNRDECTHIVSDEDAAFIAAANPAAVLELVQRLRAAEAASSEWERRAEYAGEQYRRRNKEAQAAEAIVRDLAAVGMRTCNPAIESACPLCMVDLDFGDVPHAESCPWRRAVEAKP